MNHERAALSVGLRPRSDQSIRYGLGHRFVLHALGVIETLERRPPLLFLLLVSLFLALLVLMRAGMPLAHGFGESFEVIVQRAGKIGGDQFSLLLGIWARRAETLPRDLKGDAPGSITGDDSPPVHAGELDQRPVIGHVARPGARDLQK